MTPVRFSELTAQQGLFVQLTASALHKMVLLIQSAESSTDFLPLKAQILPVFVFVSGRLAIYKTYTVTSPLVQAL